MNKNIKNFIEESEKEFDKIFPYMEGRVIVEDTPFYGVLNDNVKEFISSRQISLIKMIVKSCEASKRIELLKLRSCENDKLNWNYHQGKVHQLEDLLLELTDGK